MIKYTLPIRIVCYGHSIHEVSPDPYGRIDTSVLNLSKTLDLVKTASKIIKVTPKEDDFLYVRVRAVSAGNVIEHKNGYAELIPINDYLKNLDRYAKVSRGPNDNGDFFSYEELKRTYKTFIGKSAFVDHKNDNVENARGIILDAVWNERGKFVELLIAVDKKAFPELCRGIEMGYITDVSMGCRCGRSICSICGNEAVDEDDFCDHIRDFKGREIDGKPVFEDNRDIEFFEISFVSQGADRDAKILEKVAAHKADVLSVWPHDASSRMSNVLVKVARERNQRGDLNLRSLKRQLDNLPWS